MHCCMDHMVLNVEDDEKMINRCDVARYHRCDVARYLF